MDADCIRVRYARAPREIEELRAFIDPAYVSIYGTAPPLADVYAVVEIGGSVVACMGLEFPDATGTVAIERAYRLDRSRLPVPIVQTNVVQLSRWVSTHPKAGMVAVLAAVSHALQIGRVYGFVEQSDLLLRRSKIMGIVFWNIDHGSLDLQEIRLENREFYAQNTLRPYIVDLRQMRDALVSRIETLVIRGLP